AVRGPLDLTVRRSTLSHTRTFVARYHRPGRPFLARFARVPPSRCSTPGVVGAATAMSVAAADERRASARLRGRGEVAQLVEHTAENRGVAGSIPALATRLCPPSR